VRETSAAYRLATDMPRISLLDVNVLIAPCDGWHGHHEHAARCFVAHAAAGWASCPLTQNGALRIRSTPLPCNRCMAPRPIIWCACSPELGAIHRLELRG